MEEVLKYFDLVPADVWMILVGMVLFVALLKGLSSSIFAPYLNLVDAREDATLGAGKRARDNCEQADSLMREFELQIGQERQSALKARAQIVSDSKNEASRVVATAEQQAREQSQQVAREVQVQLEALRRTALDQAQQLGDLMAERTRNLASSPQAFDAHSSRVKGSSGVERS